MELSGQIQIPANLNAGKYSVFHLRYKAELEHTMQSEKFYTVGLIFR